MNKLAGSVSLDGKTCYTGLTPRFTAHGLDVYRLRQHESATLIETEGPHIFLQVPQLLLMSIPPGSLARGAKYQFAGPGIGSIHMLHGYAAADLGSETSSIEQFSLLISSESGELTVRVEGCTGPVHEPTKHRGKTYPQRQVFGIEFVLPERALEDVIEHKHAPNVLRKLMLRRTRRSSQPSSSSDHLSCR